MTREDEERALREALDMHGVGKTYDPKLVMPDQRSVYDQLVDLHAMATRAKMYDAADFLSEVIANLPGSRKQS